MLKLTAEQMQHLAVLESKEYVDRVYADIAKEHPERIAPDIKDRMYRAFDYAVDLGIGEPTEGALTQFLYWESSHPEFYKHPAMHAWLTKAGASSDQRWKDIMDAAKHAHGIREDIPEGAYSDDELTEEDEEMGEYE
jgi:hypothetical protein